MEKQISNAKQEAISDSDEKLKSYYTINEVNTKFSVTDRKIESSVETVNQKLEQKNGNYYGTYTPYSSNAPANSWTSRSEKLNHVGDFFFDTQTGYAYRYRVKRDCLEIKFNSNCRTESANYDWVEVFYESEGKIHVLPKLGGADIAGKSIFVPSDTFWLYFRSDGSSHDYYGFKIDAIRKSSSRKEVEDSLAVLPNDAGNIIELSGSNYPESEHDPYQDNTRKLWRYTSNESLDSYLEFDWVRVSDKDIQAAKETADRAISKVSIVEDSITSMVKKGEFGSFMRQNYNSFLIGFNESSNYVQITAGQIGLYNGSIDSDSRRAVFDQNGNHFYRDGYYVGKIGTNQWNKDNSHKGLVFDLSPEGKYMAFAQKESSYSNSYNTMLCFSRSGSIYDEYGLHLGCNFYAHGFKVINPQWEGGFGTTATIHYVQVLDVDEYGKVRRWGENGRMVFKNGILMDLTFYN